MCTKYHINSYYGGKPTKFFGIFVAPASMCALDVTDGTMEEGIEMELRAWLQPSMYKPHDAYCHIDHIELGTKPDAGL
jgi:hypothetical protein